LKIQVLSIGNEILRGHTLNTNLAFVGRLLDSYGIAIDREVCIPDTAGAITTALHSALTSADLVITIGGLGPTSDDITRTTVANYLKRNMHVDAHVQKTIAAYLVNRSIVVPEAAIRAQAMVIDNAQVLPNLHGTAPGLWCNSKYNAVVLLPGPPREFCPMFKNIVLPKLIQRSHPVYHAETIIVCGMPESHVANVIEPIIKDLSPLTVSYCAKLAQVEIQFRAAPQAKDLLCKTVSQARNVFGHAALPASCTTPVQAVGNLLLRYGLRIGTAESCTGGAIAAALTDIPGSSEYFQGAFVTYANSWKQNRVQVRPETIKQQGAVSRETAIEMLQGLLQYPDLDVGITVTGIAGPGGGTPDKPVGLVYIATGIHKTLQVTRNIFPGNREDVRQRTVSTAINQIRSDLINHAKMDDFCNPE